MLLLQGAYDVLRPVQIFCAFALLVLCAQPVPAQTRPAGPAAAAPGTTVSIPGGTPVEIALVNELSSGNAKEGDRFAFHVMKDVRINGWLVIPEGASGVGTVKDVEHAGSNGHPGKMEVAFDHVYAVDGEKVRLSATNNSQEGEQKKGAASTATIGSYLLLGPLGLFAHNFVHGKEVAISPKQSFTVFVDDTVHVVANNHTDAGDGYAH